MAPLPELGTGGRLETGGACSSAVVCVAVAAGVVAARCCFWYGLECRNVCLCFDVRSDMCAASSGGRLSCSCSHGDAAVVAAAVFRSGAAMGDAAGARLVAAVCVVGASAAVVDAWPEWGVEAFAANR